ncbi:ATP-binding protein, partial [bacterium]|nr:ATP-binding protein [bacterium]
SKEDIGIYLLREDKRVGHIYNEFKKIYIRRLNPFPLGRLEERPLLGGIPQELLEKPAEEFTLEYIQDNLRDVNTQLLLLKMHHPAVYNKIFNDFKRIFPFVEEMDIKPAKQVKQLTIQMNIPLDIVIFVLVIRETGVKEEIPIVNMSSGMLRCIIQLVDIYTMPDNSIYLIDELENSMGVKALPEMTEILLGRANNIQLIFTSHLPYIFNNVHIRYWTVLTRKGSRVKVTTGETLYKQFAKSHQDAYTQFINSELIEAGI